jgi:leucyl aminopeptidase
VFVFEKSKRAAGAFLFGSTSDKAIKEAMEDGFEGKLGQVASVRPRDSKIQRYIIVGMGPEDSATLETVRRAAASAARRAIQLKIKTLFLRPPVIGAADASAQAAVEGALLGSYTFKKYQTKVTPNALTQISILSKDDSEKKQMAHGVQRGTIFGTATNFARDLINQAPSDHTPEFLVGVAKKIAKGPIKLKIYDKKALEKMGMGAVLGVNRGSHKPPYFLHFTYKPARATRKIGICGKGITFDSGGLSLKPSASMETMKYDMSGAAIVISLFKALGELKPNVEVHGMTPMTENMPGGNALKPGDVLHTLHGRTIEVLNTDAEGRLILADALSYACRQKLDEVIDIATLTGACIVALGNQIVGLLGTDAALMTRFKMAARKAGEKVWELPLEKEYEPLLKSTVADIKNIGPVGEAGTILAGLFLKEFVDKDLPWLHIDIASSAWANSPTALSDSGSTGIMIRSLLQYFSSYN